jgi:WS/DGAT/MGAT family acyltransferase
MKRLSGTDALFLSTETSSWHQHVGGLAIIDPSESERFSFETVRNNTRDRLHHVPKFMWKIKEVPLNLDRPVWVEDPDFDIDRHLRRIAVPPPGGRKELGDLLGMLMGYQLDRRRPLWEMWYIDGVVGGQVAIITKYHHCVMDGMSGAGLAELLLDIEPDPDPRPAPALHEREPGPRVPSDWELLGRGLLPTIQTPRKMTQYAVRSGIRGGVMLQRRSRNPLHRGVSGPCFNGSVGPHRTNSFVSISLDDVRALKKHFDVKVNDVVLALVSGALRGHIQQHGESPDGPLVAGVPVSTRIDAGEGDGGNKVAIMNVSLATDIDDPVERLHQIVQSTQSAKELTEAVRARAIQSVGEVAPPLLVNLASRAALSANIGRLAPVIQNLVVSNVPGPPIPLYVCGGKVTGIYAASVLLANQGLNVTLMSYVDRVDFGFTADADLVNDLWEISDRIKDALVELMEAAGLGKPTEVHDSFDR